MYLKHQHSGNLVEVMSLGDLFDPCRLNITGRFHAGEELQDTANFKKPGLRFPSGEALPQCWLDAHYRDDAVRR